jgi:muramidase (phage lysozyme)
VDLNEITKQRVEGVISEEDFINTINQGMGRYADRLKTTVAQTGDMDAGAKYSTARDMQARKFKPQEVIDESKLTDEQRKKLQDERNKDKSLAITRINMSDMGTSLENLMTSSDLIMKGFEKVVSGADKVIDLAYKTAGKEVPEEIKRNREISRKLSGVTEQENKLKKLDSRNLQLSTDITAFEKRKKDGETLSSEDNYVLQQLKERQKSLETERIQTQRDIHKLNLEINTLTGNTRLDTGNQPTGELIISSGPSGGTASSQPARLGTLGGSGSTGSTSSTGTSGSTGTGTAPVGATSSSPASSTQTPDASSGQPPERRSDTGGETNGGIGVIRDLISSVESIGGSYDSLFGKGTTVPLSRMTIAQVLDYQLGMKKQGARSTAAGRYQFMDYTLPEYVRKARLNMDTTMFDPSHQDLLADILIREKGYDRYKRGQITATQFLNNLSMAWAGLPSPAKGGASYYGGDGLNRSHMSLDKALAKIGQARTGGIFKGPSTGYLTMLHGDEIVIPANDTITKQNLEDNLSGGETGDDIVMDLFMMLDNRVEKMIDLVTDLNHEQKMYSDI